jgi:Na+-translocating ferredoxin:NAD+ oxidoreductase RnfG subunit
MNARVKLRVLALLFFVASPLLAQERQPTEAEIGKVQVYLTPKEALHEIFDDVADVDTTWAVLEAEERGRLHELLGRAVPSDTMVVLVPRGRDGSSLGYAVIAEEVGKYRPITFMVGTTTDLEVRNVEVLVYRESRGGEVRRGRFLRQYRGKDAADAIRTNRDILNIAGATMSVNAMNHGVKRVLATLELLAARGSL